MNKLKSILVKTAASAVLAIAPLIALGGVSYANGSVDWSGHGVSNGSLDSVQCDEQNTPYLFWVFTLGGGQNTVSSATLTLGGSGSGSFNMTKPSDNAGVMQVTTGFFDLNTLTASVNFTGNLGDGTANLNISHGCPGEGEQGGGPQMDCDNDTDNSPQSECTTPQPQKDCDNDFDSSPASECATTGQVLGSNTTTPGHGAGPNQVAVVPQGSVNGGEGAASSSLSKTSAIGLFSSLLSAGAGLVLLNRRQG
jgi:hypothetical protein